MLLCIWFANAPACPACRVEAVALAPGGGGVVQARLYCPTGAAHAPAVVVAHGYLANAAFLEVPWAEDLTGLGLCALFIDRRGHGRSRLVLLLPV